MKQTILLLLAVFCGQAIFAQQVPGYYINKTGDTVRGNIDLPMKPKLKLGASSQTLPDPLEALASTEAKDIDYAKLTFDFKFSENNAKAKKNRPVESERIWLYLRRTPV